MKRLHGRKRRKLEWHPFPLGLQPLTDVIWTRVYLGYGKGSWEGRGERPARDTWKEREGERYQGEKGQRVRG